MDCRRVTTLIIEYLSGALDPKATLTWGAHLLDCNNCVALLDTYRKTIEVIRSLSPREISPEARSRIQRSLERRIRHASIVH